MPESIDDFLQSFSEMTREQAEQLYVNSSGHRHSPFPRFEISGQYGMSKAGSFMAYVIGRGKIIWDAKKEDALFYISNLVSQNFFEPLRDDRDVKVIPLKQIREIKGLHTSSDHYLRYPESY